MSNISVEYILDKIRGIAVCSLYNSFTERAFRFSMRGQKSVLNMAESFHVLGKLEENGTGQKVINYSVRPGLAFWSISVLNVIAFLYICIQFLISTVILPMFVLFPLVFQFINIIEAKWQIKECERKLLILLSPDGKG